MRKTSIKLKNSLAGLFAAILLSVTAIQFNSCDFLSVDDYFNETLKYDSVFANKYNIERYIWATAATFPDEATIWGNNYTPGPFATDEGFTLFGQGEFRGMAYTIGNITPTNLYGMNTWNGMYLIIRKVNTILSRIDEVADMTSFERMEFLGYVYFMRAYAYYHLAMKYGPVVLLGDEVLNNN
ncbi:MAG: RagB/SusD family nutrient uptake outer membrane protein, partial [Tannerella sp.]|nr:RagB/SusD family nutrient uptake outer membrane protein [Tannerella sp.]